MSACLFIRCLSFFFSEIGHAMAVGTIHSLRFFLLVAKQYYACNLCMKFISNLIYSKNPTTDDSPQYYIKLLLRYCAPSPHPIHTKCILFAVVLLFQQNEDEVKRSVSGTEAMESRKEATIGQFGPEAPYHIQKCLIFGVEIMNSCVRVLFCNATLNFSLLVYCVRHFNAKCIIRSYDKFY